MQKKQDINVKRLNAILRLRLFFSTEKELSDFVGLKLKNNKFYKSTGFKAEAYFNQFAKMCSQKTFGKVDLAELLEQYEATSEFFQGNMATLSLATRKRILLSLFEHVFLGKEFEGDGITRCREKLVCERFDRKDKDGELNVGILLLLAHGLIPTFNNKSAQDVKDIIGDFQKAHDAMREIAKENGAKCLYDFEEHPYLAEMLKAIEDEKKGLKYFNRILLIYLTNDILHTIFIYQQASRVLEYSRKVSLLPLNLSGLWHDKKDAPNIIWQFVPSNDDGDCQLYRLRIEYNEKRIYYTLFYVSFKDMGIKGFCQTSVMLPSFLYYNLLGKRIPGNALTHATTKIEYDTDRKAVVSLMFLDDSSLGNRGQILTPLTDGMDTFQSIIEHTGKYWDYEDIDENEETSVVVEHVMTSLSGTSVLLKIGDEIYKIDYYNADGNETIPGISHLTCRDHVFIENLIDEDGMERSFLCLDSIGHNIEIHDNKIDSPFIHKVESLRELF